MSNSSQNPQQQIQIRPIKAQNFDNFSSIYQSLKLHVDPEEFKILNGQTSKDSKEYAGDSTEQGVFQFQDEDIIECHLSTKSLLSWPVVSIKVFGTDSDGRETVLGYSSCSLPLSSIEKTLLCYCPTNPQDQSYESLIHSNLSIVNDTMLQSNVDRYGMQTKTTGVVEVEFNTFLQGFSHHGIEMVNDNSNFKEKLETNLKLDFI